MRIVLTNPFCWPHVRRGSERQIEIIANWLGTHGHQITYLSTHPLNAQVEVMPYGKRVLARTIRGLPRLHIDESHTFLLTSLRQLKGTDANIVHSFYYTDSLAASMMKRGNRFRTVLQLHGIAVPGVSCRRFLPPEGFMLRNALRRADAVVTCSRFIADQMEEQYQVRPRIIMSAVDMASWPLGEGPADGRPTILSVADFTVRRKGVHPLVKAFVRLRETYPDATLRLSGRMPDELQKELRGLAGEPACSAIDFLGLGKPDDLAREYQQANIMVLPAMSEPSGGAMMEALASGTPVVATNHGGLPEYLRPDTSVLFEPAGHQDEIQNIDGLTEALLAGLRLSQTPGIRQRCRAHAEKFSGSALGPEFEELYASVQ